MASCKYSGYISSPGDFAKPQSRPTSSHVMTASPSVRPKCHIWESPRQKGPDESRRAIGHADCPKRINQILRLEKD